MEVLLRKTFTGFAPENGEDEKLKRFKLGDTVKAKIVVPRNVGFHRKFFALLKLTFQNQELIDNYDDFREAVTITAGFFRWSKDLHGNEFKRAKSISFAKMDQAEFEEVYSRVLDVCLNVLGCEKKELENEILNFL